MYAGKRGGYYRKSRLGFKQPMDDWEKKRVTALLEQGLSYRDIQRSTGIGYMTVCRFVKKRQMVLASML